MITQIKSFKCQGCGHEWHLTMDGSKPNYELIWDSAMMLHRANCAHEQYIRKEQYGNSKKLL